MAILEAPCFPVSPPPPANTRITSTETGWNVRYLNTDERWSEHAGILAEQHADGYSIPLTSRKGFKGTLWRAVQHV